MTWGWVKFFFLLLLLFKWTSPLIVICYYYFHFLEIRLFTFTKSNTSEKPQRCCENVHNSLKKKSIIANITGIKSTLIDLVCFFFKPVWCTASYTGSLQADHFDSHLKMLIELFSPRTQTPTSLIAFKWKYGAEQRPTCKQLSFAEKNMLSGTRLNDASLNKDCFDVWKRPLDWAQRKSGEENARQLCLSGPCDGNKHKSRWIEKASERIKAGPSRGKGKRTDEPWRESETCQKARQEVGDKMKDSADHPLLGKERTGWKDGKKDRYR